MPTISACIVAYCDYEEVCAAVRSILHFTPAPDFTLYIVDNASPDGCGKQLTDTDWADPRVQVLCLPENVGFGRGHNAVLGKLHSSVHVILNPDIVPVSYTHLDGYKRQPQDIKAVCREIPRFFLYVLYYPKATRLQHPQFES